MKYLILLLLAPMISFGQSRDAMLQGTWIKTKAEMKDGSRIVDHNGCGMDFVKYSFTPDGFANMSNEVLFDGFKIKYQLLGDSLVAGGTVYNIIAMSKDTMKLSFFAPGVEDGQLPVYSFVKVPGGNPHATATFDAALKDSVYQANNVLFPLSKGTFSNLMAVMPGKYDKGTIKASFVVDKKGRVKNFTIIQLDSVSKSFAKEVGNAFGDLAWIPAQKNNLPINSIIQLTIKTGYKTYSGNNYGMNSLAIAYDFLPKAPYPPLDPDEAATAQQYFKTAISQLNAGNNDKAVELLGKCIEVDNINLNAYTLRAMINARTGKTKEACKDWTALAGLGQVSAAKNLAKYCK